jgi:hypothetical protein
MTVSTPAAFADAAVAVDASAHDHDWRLRAVWYEDGTATEEYTCTGCVGVTFR